MSVNALGEGVGVHLPKVVGNSSVAMSKASRLCVEPPVLSYECA